jgi:SAM-dependent methyltransferase
MKEPRHSDFVHPPAASDVSSFYEGQDLEALASLPRYYDWILSYFRPFLLGRVLEIGAGLGQIAARYAGQPERLILLEPAKNLYGRLKERFANQSHVTTVCGLVEDLRPGEMGDGAISHFDAVLLVNVLEHVEDDGLMLRQIFQLLRPGGVLLVFVPALPWLYGTLDALVHHVRRYTRGSLTTTIEGAGFGVELARYFDLVGVLPWFITGRVLRRKEFSEGAAKLYDLCGVPMGRLMERLFEPPIGKNLVLVARRPKDILPS